MLKEEIRDFLRQCGMRLNTDLGQHFLIEEQILDNIVATADLQPTDTVIEIGPGIGVLTRELLKQVKHVTAIEIDDRLIPLLRVFTGIGNPKLEIIRGNALQAEMPTKEKYKVVANIPYHITSPLLTHLFLESPLRPTSITVLIQREVAENICSKESESILSVLVHLFGTPSLICIVPPAAFFPPPKVDSAVLHIECFEKPLADLVTVDRILRLAKLAFSKRRKMLSNTIGTLPEGTAAMSKVSIDPKRRPQTLSIEEWIALDTALHSAPVEEQ